MHPSRILLLTLLAATLTGCKPDAAVRKGEVIGDGTTPRRNPPPYAPQHPADAVPPADAGEITGTISFLGKVPNASATIDTSMDPACAMGGGTGHLPVEQYAVTDGKLANVFVYVKSGPPQAMQSGPISGKPVVLDQRNCRYVPHVIALMQGGSVEFRNSDPTMHNIHTMPTTVGNQVIDISQTPRGQPITRSFPAPETMLPVRCNNHPWMSAFINISPTAFFAVSDAQGRFTIAGLPPGDYDLIAVQEKLGTKAMHVTVPPRGTAKLSLSFTPN